jgi:cell division protein FtsB
MSEVKQYTFKGAAGVYIYLADYERLQAENAALQQRLTIADQRIDDLGADMAKALELNEKVRELAFKNNATMPNVAPYYIVRIRDAFRAHQSAPAAKGGS